MIHQSVHLERAPAEPVRERFLIRPDAKNPEKVQKRCEAAGHMTFAPH